MPVSATAGLGASPPASSTRWRRLNCPATATASATNTACSTRRSKTANRSSIRTTGCATAIRGNSPDRKCCIRSSSTAGSSSSGTKTAPCATTGSTPRKSWPWPTTRRYPVTAARRSTTCGYGRPSLRAISICATSTKATISRLLPTRTPRKTCRKCSTPTTPPKWARSCA